MNIHEYQAKNILRKFGVKVPRGRITESALEAYEAAKEFKGPVVVKAQIHAGGRGKAGGIKVARTPEEAEVAARELIGKRLVTHQTGPDGREVKRVLVEEGLHIQKEYYLGLVIDRARQAPVFMASTEGGVEIEKVAAERPQAILREPVNPMVGFQPFQARKLAFGLQLPKASAGKAVQFMVGLYQAFTANDASLAEINPFVLTQEGELYALDAKMVFDDNALYRHEDLRELRDLAEEDPLEVKASSFGLNYIKLDGNVGCMVNGAGLAMATMDIIQLAGGRPANFLDVGGGASADQVKNAFEILLLDSCVRAVLINIFGGILRCDVLAQGVVEAARSVHVKVPVVVRLEGTNVEEGQRILRESGLNFTVASSMKEAADRVVALAQGTGYSSGPERPRG
ncbi:MAG: ADP-forming succinate--CoA ligase subunit beta [Acidobacteria bacterium]|nr:ADP-forming succinate--CoA ligase subunit beta [Acidobacteriota bacterium]